MSFDIDNMDIKEVYKHLIGEWGNPIGERQEEVREWYHNYKLWKKETQKYKKYLKKKHKLDKKADIKFLEMLFLGEGVSSAKQGRISPETFKKFINEPDVLETLRDLIVKVNEETIENFCDAMRNCNIKHNHYTKNNWQIIDRIIAAITKEVSSTAYIEAFNNVFKFFEKKNLIDTYIGTRIDCNNAENKKIILWYRKNLYLMNELKRRFKKELKTKKVNITKLSIFVWEFNEYDIKDMLSFKEAGAKHKVLTSAEISQMRQEKIKNKRKLNQPRGFVPLGDSESPRRTFAGDCGFTYALRFGKTNIWKIGRSVNVENRIEQINNHVPHEEVSWCPEWVLVCKEKWNTEDEAHEMEGKILHILHKRKKWTRGERVKCTRAELKQVWNDVLEKMLS